MRRTVIAVVLACNVACQTARVRREVHVHEDVMLVPEGVAASEPRAHRVTLLMHTGLTRTFDDAEIGRDGERLRIRGPARAEETVMTSDVAAVRLERELVGEDREKLAMRDEVRDDVQVTPGWGIVLGVLGLIATSIIVVNNIER